MKQIYLDNSATSYPKPSAVLEAVYDYMKNNGTNINRSSYEASFSVAQTVLETRMMIAELFNFPESRNVIFTPNITFSLNYILKGILKKGDHVLTSSVEHNAVIRPLEKLSLADGITYDKIPMNESNQPDFERAKDLITSKTKAVVITNGSNVSGTIYPLSKAGNFCKENNLIFVVDSAQTAGLIPIDMEKDNIDILAFTGHKSLMGPQGTGGFVISEECSKIMDTLIEGGTGSFSDKYDMPKVLPDRFEAGTANIPGIIGLNAALKHLKTTGIENILHHEQNLSKLFIEKIDKLPNVNIIDKDGLRAGTVSINFEGKDNAQIAYELESDYKILTRCGLHCAPDAHKTFGTYPNGTVRFSFGYYNITEEVLNTVSAIKKIIQVEK